MQLETFLRHQGYSKKQIRQSFLQEKIFIDGRTPQRIGQTIDPGYQKIFLEGEQIKGERHHYFILHKPQGYVTSSWGSVPQTVYELLPPAWRNVPYVGRLDKNTTGLLFFTNNGQLAKVMQQPSSHVVKTYRVTTLEPLAATDSQKFQDGIIIDANTLCRPADFILCDDHTALVTLTEGKFHQVKKMFLSVGKKVIALERLSFGPLQLPKDLGVGQARSLTLGEFNQIRDFFQ